MKPKKKKTMTLVHEFKEKKTKTISFDAVNISILHATPDTWQILKVRK